MLFIWDGGIGELILAERVKPQSCLQPLRLETRAKDDKSLTENCRTKVFLCPIEKFCREWH